MEEHRKIKGRDGMPTHYYRYTDDFEFGMIQRTKTVQPTPYTNKKYFTPDRYETSAEAQRKLALPYRPTWRIGPIADSDIPEFDALPLREVAMRYGQPGGGYEAATTRTVFLFDMTPLS